MNRCAFVHMQTPDMMDNAIQALHNSNFKGVTINVERGRTKDRAPGSGGDGRDSGGRGGFRGGRGGFNQQSRSSYDGEWVEGIVGLSGFVTGCLFFFFFQMVTVRVVR